MSGNQRGRWALVIFLILAGTTGQGASIILSDFQGALVKAPGRSAGGFDTPVILYKINSRPNTLIAKNTGPDQIEVSGRDYEVLKKYLGSGEKAHGPTGAKFTLDSGQEIDPGYYFVRSPESFRYFQESQESATNYLLESLKKAETQAEKTKDAEWRGNFWNFVRVVLSNPETAKTFGVLSDRGYSRDEWKEFYTHLQADPDYGIKNLPNFNYFQSVAGTDYEKYKAYKDSLRTEAMVIEQIAQQLGRVNLTEADRKLSPDGLNDGLYHSIVYAGSDPRVLSDIVGVFQRLARRRLFQVKFVVVNTGTDRQVSESGRPQFLVVKSDGTFRKANPLEVMGEPKSLNAMQKRLVNGSSCKVLLKEIL